MINYLTFKHEESIDENGDCLCAHCMINMRVLIHCLDYLISELLLKKEISIVEAMSFLKDEGQGTMDIITEGGCIDDDMCGQLKDKLYTKELLGRLRIKIILECVKLMYYNLHIGKIYMMYDRTFIKCENKNEYLYRIYLDDDGVIQMEDIDGSDLDYSQGKVILEKYLENIDYKILRFDLGSFFYYDKIEFGTVTSVIKAINNHYDVERKEREREITFKSETAKIDNDYKKFKEVYFKEE